MNTQRFYNPIVSWLLHSPLHHLGDQHTLVLTVTGRKSGKRYSFPVAYLRDGETLLVMTYRERAWWKNLSDSGAPVTVYVDGHEVAARAETSTDPDVVTSALLLFLQQVPTWRWELHVKLDANGQPEDSEALKRLAQDDLVLCTIQAERTLPDEQDTLRQRASSIAAK